MRYPLMVFLLTAFGVSSAFGQAMAAAPATTPTAPPAAPATPTASANTTATAPAPPPIIPTHPDPKDPHSWLWEFELAGFTEKDYRTAVDAVFADYERRLGRTIAPGPKRRVGLKVMTATPGLSTPPALVRAVISSLEARGFKPEELFIVDQSESNLRAAGFLPPIGQGGNFTFDGVPVLVLESGRYYVEKSAANYDDPLSPPDLDIQHRIQDANDWPFRPSDRLSLVPVPLLQSVDFWINLPVGMDAENLGVCGTLVNASLYFSSNTQRFMDNQTSGQLAVANMLANAPELRNTWAFSLLSLERYQYVGGPDFNSLYNQSERLLLFSANPVVMDSVLFEHINYRRREQNMPLLDRPAYIDYASQPQVGLGSYQRDRIYLVTMP
jgi:hypothetical protein